MGSHKEEWIKVIEKNMVLMIIIGILSLLLIFCLQAMIWLSKNRTINVEVPPNSISFTVGSKEHILLWGRFFVDIISSFSNSNYQDRMAIMLGFVEAGEKEKEIKEKVLQLMSEIQRDNIYQSFYPNEDSWGIDKVSKGVHRVSVHGLLRRYLADQKKFDSKQTYWVELKYKGGRVTLQGFGYEKD